MYKSLKRLASVSLLGSILVLAFGCAAAYDCYPCGRVSCGYCPPPPLPYRIGQSCCMDSAGQKYLGTVAPVPVSSEPNLPVAEPAPYFYFSSPAHAPTEERQPSDSK